MSVKCCENRVQDKGYICLCLGTFLLPRVFTGSRDEMTSLVNSSLPYSSPVKETLHFYSCICSLKYMTWRFPSQNILKNNLSCLPVLSTTCIGHCWLQRKLWRLHRNERFERYCPKGERMSILLSFSLQTYQQRTSETNRKSQLAWKLGSLELQVQGTVCWAERAILQ